MKTHVQSWFTLNLDKEKDRGTVKAVYGPDKCDPESFKLDPREFLVSVERAGEKANPSDIAWVHLLADAEIFAKVREWIRHCNAFDADRVDIAEDEILVQVRSEYCTHTSHGLDCDCYKQ